MSQSQFGEVGQLGELLKSSMVPVQRLPEFTLLRYFVQSVSAWDHSPQMVGPQLELC